MEIKYPEILLEYYTNIFIAIGTTGRTYFSKYKTPREKAKAVIDSRYWNIKNINVVFAKLIHDQKLLNVGVCPTCGEHPIGVDETWPYSWSWNKGPTLYICIDCYEEGTKFESELKQEQKTIGNPTLNKLQKHKSDSLMVKIRGYILFLLGFFAITLPGYYILIHPNINHGNINKTDNTNLNSNHYRKDSISELQSWQQIPNRDASNDASITNEIKTSPGNQSASEYTNIILNKQVLIKNIQQYICLNYNQIINLYHNKNTNHYYDSIYSSVDEKSTCLYNYENEKNQKIIFCLYEGPHNEIYNFTFGDLNDDQLQDAIVTFTVEGFDGGNGHGRFHALIYSIDNTTFVESVFHIYPPIEIKSFSNGKIFGSQVGWNDDDGKCCPSLKRNVIYNYNFKTQKLDLIKEFEYRKSN